MLHRIPKGALKLITLNSTDAPKNFQKHTNHKKRALSTRKRIQGNSSIDKRRIGKLYETSILLAGLEKTGLEPGGESRGPFLMIIEKTEKAMSSIHTFLSTLDW